jgi:hypothetical protein
VYEVISSKMQDQLNSEDFCELEKEYHLALSGGQLWDDEIFIPLSCQ